MSVKMIQDRLDGYGYRSTIEEEQALREITQEIALARREGRLPGEVSSTVQDALLFSFCAKHWRVVAS